MRDDTTSETPVDGVTDDASPAPSLAVAQVGARPPAGKLASAVSGRLVADIAAAGWPTGEVIGSEAELVERYGVSRAVFREAVRLLEHQNVARMRRGPGGGLVVTTPTVDTAIDAVMVYLLYVRAGLDEVLEVRLALEESAAELATERLSEDGIARLRDLVEREGRGESVNPRDLHGLVAGLTGNPAIEFFVDLLTRVALVYTPEVPRSDRGVVAAMCGAHAKIVESIVGGNGSQAAARMRRHLRAEADFVAKRMPFRPRLGAIFATSPGESKLAENVARKLFAEITADGWQVGRSLGSETELMERFGVSRAILREATRVLEHHQIAVMRRGPGGGLFVAEPGIDATSEAVALYLDRRSIRPSDLFEVRAIIEMAVLDRVIARLDGSVVQALQDVHEIERHASRESFPVVGHDLHVVLAELSGNRVLALFADVLVRLSRSHGAAPEGVTDPLPTDEVINTHHGIIEAIVARDVDLARLRMRRHLAALVRWVR